MPTPTPTNYATSPMPTVATSPPIDTPRVCHVTTAAPPLIEGCGQTTFATSQLSTAATNAHITEKNTRPRTPHHKARGGGRVDGSKEEGERRRERGIEEEREAAGAQVGGWGAALAAPVSCRFKWGQHVLPPFLFVSNGAACAAPFLCLLNGGSVCCPCFSSF